MALLKPAELRNDPVGAPAEQGDAFTGSSVPSPSWDEGQIFRDTFLLYLSDPWLNGALRMAGQVLCAVLLELQGELPAWPESATRTELRAAAADLRHLEGFLTNVGRERELCSLSSDDARLSRFAADAARTAAKLAASIEHQLAMGASA